MSEERFTKYSNDGPLVCQIEAFLVLCYTSVIHGTVHGNAKKSMLQSAQEVDSYCKGGVVICGRDEPLLLKGDELAILALCLQRRGTS